MLTRGRKAQRNEIPPSGVSASGAAATRRSCSSRLSFSGCSTETRHPVRLASSLVRVRVRGRIRVRIRVSVKVRAGVRFRVGVGVRVGVRVGVGVRLRLRLRVRVRVRRARS